MDWSTFLLFNSTLVIKMLLITEQFSFQGNPDSRSENELA